MGEVMPLKSVLEHLASGMNSSSASYTCPKCGRVVEPLVLHVLGRTVNIRRTCQCAQERYRREAEAEHRRQFQMRIESLFALAELGPRFKGCTFETWRERPGAEECYRVAQDYVENWTTYSQRGQGLIVFGPPGNGKTHLAAAIVNALIHTEQVVCIFRSVPILLTKLRSVYDDSAKVTEQDMLTALREAELLVLDDFGAEKLTAWAEAMMYTIIDERYRWLKPIIITTNCELDAFAERVGLRTFDRLLEMCAIVRNSASSYRQEQAKTRRR